MARGFGATRGVASTDVIVATVNLSPLARIAGFLFQNRNGGGGGGFGRYFDIEVGACAFYIDSGSNEIVFQYGWGGSTALWRAAHPGSGWHSVGFDYDPSSTANDPIIYVDGVSVTVTEQVAPSGSANSGNTSALRIGNRGSQDRNWDGDLARVAWWRGGSPTAAEFAAMHAGTVPSGIQAATLIYYNSLSGGTTPSVGTNVSVTGTADRADPSFGSNATANGATLTATASLIAGAANGASASTANGATLTATASLITGGGTLNFQAAGMEFGRRTGLGINTFALDAAADYRYTVHADGLTLGAAIITSGVVATDAGGKLPNLVSTSIAPGTLYRVHAIRQADGEAATFRMRAQA
jgi:hypothetical protein